MKMNIFLKPVMNSNQSYFFRSSVVLCNLSTKDKFCLQNFGDIFNLEGVKLRKFNEYEDLYLEKLDQNISDYIFIYNI